VVVVGAFVLIHGELVALADRLQVARSFLVVAAEEKRNGELKVRSLFEGSAFEVRLLLALAGALFQGHLLDGLLVLSFDLQVP
jgi:hypothetical protein